MNVLTLDVGLSTGVVISEFYPKQIPKLIRSKTFDSRGMFDDVTSTFGFFHRVHAFVEGEEQRRPVHILVEYPFHSQKSDNWKELEVLISNWQAWLKDAYRGSFTNIIPVKPETWKQTPAKKFNVFKNQDNEYWRGYKPTQHEKDAAAIAYWYAFWGYRRL